MKIFVVHRGSDATQAQKALKAAQKTMGTKFTICLLKSAGTASWKAEAGRAISSSEVVCVFNPLACSESKNAKWEIAQAEKLGKPILEVPADDSHVDLIGKLKPLYHLTAEFESCFDEEIDRVSAMELFRVMIDSSEALIQRRQKTSAFFITVIGSLLAIAGLMVKAGAINEGTIWLVYGFSGAALLLCNSWRNLLDNYGKLNKAKFDVILRLEKCLPAEIFSAEWIALGKGLRPEKYKSFTATEKNVPLYFALLIALLTLIAIGWHVWG